MKKNFREKIESKEKKERLIKKVYKFEKKKDFENFLFFFEKRRRLNNDNLNKIRNLKFEMPNFRENIYKIEFEGNVFKNNLEFEISNKKNFSAIFLLKLIFDIFKAICFFKIKFSVFFKFEPRFINILENNDNSKLPHFVINEEYFFIEKKNLIFNKENNNIRKRIGFLIIDCGNLNLEKKK